MPALSSVTTSASKMNSAHQSSPIRHQLTTVLNNRLSQNQVRDHSKMTSAGGGLGQILTKEKGLRWYGTDRGGGQNPKNMNDVICERSYMQSKFDLSMLLYFCYVFLTIATYKCILQVNQPLFWQTSESIAGASIADLPPPPPVPTVTGNHLEPRVPTDFLPPSPPPPPPAGATSTGLVVRFCSLELFYILRILLQNENEDFKTNFYSNEWHFQMFQWLRNVYYCNWSPSVSNIHVPILRVYNTTTCSSTASNSNDKWIPRSTCSPAPASSATRSTNQWKRIKRRNLKKGQFGLNKWNKPVFILLWIYLMFLSN